MLNTPEVPQEMAMTSDDFAETKIGPPLFVRNGPSDNRIGSQLLHNKLDRS